MDHIISMHTWVSLSNEQRSRIRYIFKIPRSSHTVVNDGRIETDGTTHEDFKHLTVQKMQDYLNDSSEDFHKLFDKVLAKVQDEIEGKPVIEIVIESKPKSNGKKKSK